MAGTRNSTTIYSSLGGKYEIEERDGYIQVFYGGVMIFDSREVLMPKLETTPQD